MESKSVSGDTNLDVVLSYFIYDQKIKPNKKNARKLYVQEVINLNNIQFKSKFYALVLDKFKQVQR